MHGDSLSTLRALPLFASLDEATLEAVAGRTVERAFPERTRVFRQGDPCQGLHVVMEGQVRVYRANREGREQVLHVRGPGQALAEVPLFDGGPYPASARAEVDSRLLLLPIDAFQQLYRTHPEVADATIRELGRRLRRMVGLVEKISLRDVPARVALTLLEYAEKGGPAHDGQAFDLPRTQEEMAAELATSRESVSRALARLRREGAIEQRGSRVRIVSLARLQAVAWAD
ncbi:MAG TPA: Crp/Fnr family transcriptional regulator [Longimicrobiaceae bacterium]